MKLDESYIQQLVSQGGPVEHDYHEFTDWVRRTHHRMASGEVSPGELSAIRHSFGKTLSTGTMQGLAHSKPHGYAGDFEIIDRIYLRRVSREPGLTNWDLYWHQQSAALAVRNRKTYFHHLLDRHSARQQPLRVLKIASGPGRSMYEWLKANPLANVFFHCIELDPAAIHHAASLNREFLDRITFTCRNALRYQPEGYYDLIWAAGIFDYFTDPLFLRLLRRFAQVVAPGGELVIGNFSPENPSRPYMELVGDWHLHHRSADQLRGLASQAGIASDRVSIGSEPERVNLFLHVSA